MSTQDAKRAGPIDVTVGALVRSRRVSVEMTQKALAAQLGARLQQIQRYESGVSRIGASRLHAIARILGVPVSFFFDDLGATAVPGDAAADGLVTPEAIQLSQAFLRIDDARFRRHLVDLVQSIADLGNKDSAASKRVRRTDRKRGAE